MTQLKNIFTVMCFATFCYGQNNSVETQTSKYAGTFTYSLGKDKATGTILIYPSTDKTVLFYIDLNIGAPSYNMGSLFGRLKVADGQGTFETIDKGCRWKVEFTTQGLTIMTINNLNDCGFGHGVSADGEYKRTSKLVPDYFETGEGIKYQFRSTTPEQFNK
jgi:hypothetical protein